jgi:AcrR family transcriptional regulator
MQDRPDAPDLLEAVAEFLVADVREWAPAEKRFLMLVAANVCAVVARELRAGEEPTREDLELFSSLLGEDPAAGDPEQAAREAAAALAKRIRSGELDAELDTLVNDLQEHVRRKLEVARPGYDEPPGSNT